MNNSNNDHLQARYTQMIFKFLAGNASYGEEQELQKWIDEEPENSETFAFYRNLWLATSAGSDSGYYNASKAWKKIEKNIKKSEIREPAVRVFISGNSGLQYFLKIAAFIIFIFLLGFVCSLLFIDKNTHTEEIYSLVCTPLGSKSKIILPDSTQVWLNAGSTLAYQTQADTKERNISLEGEAYFKVKSEKSRPFIVRTNKIDFLALGTSFNVKAYPEDTLLTATLIEGSIKVDADVNNNRLSFTLKPNQNLVVPVKSTIGPESIKIEELDKNITEAIVSWKEEQWTIQGEPLNTLAILLERKYNIKIHIISDKLYDYKFTGTIKNETFEQVLQYLRFTTPLKYKVGKGEVWWDIDPELEKSYSKILEKQ